MKIRYVSQEPDKIHKTKKQVEKLLDTLWDRENLRLKQRQVRSIMEPSSDNTIRLIEAQTRFNYIQDIHRILEIHS